MELTDREFGEVIGALQIVRDNARKQGREPADVISALAKLTADVMPYTAGIEFWLIDGRKPRENELVTEGRLLGRCDQALG